ncbi:acyl-CoA dehydrogenase [Bradyrhizobium sp. LTSP885]|uniref:acyl-CoA dehydrogenase family protein n=1 Tax=Bradyrhizobium sp. LTSP885 TaxID=1619232 RepID=UPI0005CAC541|nr:acyl-CoA dehydrogenase family protein [Bradyrhizobium sp. LTSP885]KJC37054.1 acyl-CoA dehydrogenase [Bradyrhizobium sp. LTSP885]
MGSLALSRVDIADPAPTIADEVARLARQELAPLASAIDAGSVYPGEFLRRLGEVGAWASHVPQEGPADLRCAIQSMAALGEICGATAFMAWCQNTLVWYAANSTNMKLATRFGDAFSSGRVLGGTGLSNPMKSFFGIERLKLKGRKVEGGYVVRGALPWVSNLGPDHYFGTIFEREDEDGKPESGGTVMFLADCSDPAITLTPCKPFLAMDGTGTYGVQFRDVFVPDELILAETAAPFVKKIRAGFILLQAGMGLGLMKDCINIMDEVHAPLGHVNRYLPQQPLQFRELYAEFEKEAMTLARDPYNEDDSYWRRVVALRLRIGDASVAVAHAAMLHCGARGYLKSHRAQRRLREAYFVAIVTPATKQLRKMLADA